MGKKLKVAPNRKVRRATKSVVKKLHATYSASGAARWLACAGSTKLSETAPPVPDNVYSIEGTEAHECLEFVLGNRASEASLKMASKKYDVEMVKHAVEASRYVMKRLAKLDGADLHLEVRADLPVSEPDQFGTADVVIVQLYGRLIVMDYKYGAKIVDVRANPQLIYYALGVAHKYGYDFTDIELVIIQPRAEVDGESVRSYVMTVDELIGWKATFERGIKNSKRKDAELFSGDHCQYCPAKIICPEISRKAMAQAKIDFADDATLPVPILSKAATLTPENLGAVLKAAGNLETWIGSVRSYAYTQAVRGQKVEGFKLVPKRASRKWVDAFGAAADAASMFGKKAFTKSELLSPAQLEKISKDAKVFVAKNTASISSGLSLVPNSNKATAVNPVANDFNSPVERTVKPSKQNKAKAKKALAKL